MLFDTDFTQFIETLTPLLPEVSIGLDASEALDTIYLDCSLDKFTVVVDRFNGKYGVTSIGPGSECHPFQQHAHEHFVTATGAAVRVAQLLKTRTHTKDPYP